MWCYGWGDGAVDVFLVIDVAALGGEMVGEFLGSVVHAVMHGGGVLGVCGCRGGVAVVLYVLSLMWVLLLVSVCICLFFVIVIIVLVVGVGGVLAAQTDQAGRS